MRRRAAGERRPATVAYSFLDLGEGGAQRLTIATARHLRRELFRPVFLCARGGGALVARARGEGLEVHELGRLRRPFDLAVVPVAAARFRRLRPAVVHVALYSRASPYLRLAAHLARVPLVVAQEWGRAEPPPLSRRLADRLLARGSRFVAVSEHHRAELLAAGRAPARVATVRSGIEVERFAGGEREETRRNLGIPDGRPVALVAARLHPMKGHADLFDLLPAVLDRVPGLVVLVAGQGPLAGGLAARAAIQPLAGSVRMLGHREEMADLLAAADLALLPSRSEGLPSALLEAYAASRPAVATAVGGVPEALADGVEGRLVPPGDGPALRDAIVELALDPGMRRAMGARARMRVVREFTAAAATRRLEAVYLGWLAERGATA